MNLTEARTKLNDRRFLLGAFRRRAAFRFLAEATEPEAAVILAEALEGKRLLGGLSHGVHPLARRIRAVLASLKAPADQAKIDRLWEHWVHTRDHALGSVLAEIAVPADEGAARVWSLLVLGEPQLIQADTDSLLVVARALGEGAGPVQKRAELFLHRLRSKGAPEARWLLLLAGRFNEIGCALPAIDEVREDRRHPDPAVRAKATEYLAGLPEPARLYACLADGAFEKIGDARTAAFKLVPFAQGTSGEARQLFEDYLTWLDGKRPESALALRLKLGREPEMAQDVGTARAVLGALEDEDADVRGAALRYALALPDRTDLNGELFAAWRRTGSKDIEARLEAEGRQPADPAEEVLLHLVTGRVDRYLSMQDERGAWFQEAYAMASPALRQRLSRTVLDSTEARLMEEYGRAAGPDADREAVLRGLAKAGEEDLLFEKTKTYGLTLAQVLPLVERWSGIAARPRDATRRAAVDRAVEAYRAMGTIDLEEAPPPPAGLVDIFTWWERQEVADGQIRAELGAADPLIRARALYLGRRRGLVPDDVLRQALEDKHWPLRMVARLLSPMAVAGTGDDHVLWVSACAGADVQTLRTPIGDSPEVFEEMSARLEKLREAAASPVTRRLRGALEILCAFTGAFAGGLLVVHESDDAPPRDVVVRDAGEDLLAMVKQTRRKEQT